MNTLTYEGTESITCDNCMKEINKGESFVYLNDEVICLDCLVKFAQEVEKKRF